MRKTRKKTRKEIIKNIIKVVKDKKVSRWVLDDMDNTAELYKRGSDGEK